MLKLLLKKSRTLAAVLQGGYRYDLTPAHRMQISKLHEAADALTIRHAALKAIEFLETTYNGHKQNIIDETGVNCNRTPAEEARYQMDLVKRTITNVMHFLPPATKEEYADFLEAHFARGEKYTHYYNCPFENYGILIARRDMVLPRGYGAQSLQIIVPPNIKVTEPPGRDSHNNLYFVGQPPYDQKQRDYGFIVPVFPDVMEILAKRNKNHEKRRDQSGRPLGVPEARKLMAPEDL